MELEDGRVSIYRRWWRELFSLAPWLAVLIGWVGMALPILANGLIIWIFERTTGRGPSAFLPGLLQEAWIIGTFVLSGVLLFVFYTSSYRWISRKMDARRSRRASDASRARS